MILATLHWCFQVETSQGLAANTIQLCASLLKHKDASVRSKAAQVTFDLSLPLEGKEVCYSCACIPPLMELLCDEDSDTRAQATASLMRLELDLMGLSPDRLHHFQSSHYHFHHHHLLPHTITTCSLTPSPPAPSHHHHLLTHTITTCSLTPSPPAPSHHHHLLPHTITTYSLTPSPPASSHHTLPSPPAPSHHHSYPPSPPAPSHHRFYPPIITTTSIAVITKAKHAMVEQGAIPLLTAQLQHSSSEVRLNTIKVRVCVCMCVWCVCVCVCAGAHTGDNPLPQALTLLAETPKGKGELRAQLEKVRDGEEEQLH